jgi:regulatory protein
VIDENMNIDDGREEQTALDIARKALRRSSEEDSFKLRQKLFRTLVSKGFSYDLSRSVTDRVMEEIEDED